MSETEKIESIFESALIYPILCLDLKLNPKIGHLFFLSNFRCQARLQDIENNQFRNKNPSEEGFLLGIFVRVDRCSHIDIE